MRRLNRQWWFGIGAAVLVPALMWAANLTLPHVFSPGQPIRSSEVNDNFNAVAAAVNATADALDAGARFRSGSRLQVLGYVTPEGTVIPRQGIATPSFFDSQVGAYCDPLLASDGQLRCLPLGASWCPTGGGSGGLRCGGLQGLRGYYSDSACSVQLCVVGLAPVATVPGWPTATASFYERTVTDGGTGFDVFGLGGTYSSGVFSWNLLPDGGCACSPPTETVYYPGPVQNPAQFVPFQGTTL